MRVICKHCRKTFDITRKEMVLTAFNGSEPMRLVEIAKKVDMTSAGLLYQLEQLIKEEKVERIEYHNLPIYKRK